MNTRKNTAERPRERRLLIVEDNPIFAAQMTRAIELLPHLWNVTCVSEGLRAIELVAARKQSFDLALVDLGLEDISGIEVIRACLKQAPDMPSIVISVTSSEPAVCSAIEAGAKGYIVKADPLQTITDSISQVLQGIYPLSPSLARHLFRKLAQDSIGGQRRSAEREFKLTPRELETLRHLGRGLSYQEVASRMGVTLSTVQWNVRNLYRKLNVRSQVQAILKARDHELI